MTYIVKIFSLIVIIAVLAGCGQSGPLFMPGHPPPGYPIKEINKERQLQQRKQTTGMYVGVNSGLIR